MPISRVNQPAHAGYICQHRHHRHRHRFEVRLTRADLELEVELEGSAWRGKYAVAATGTATGCGKQGEGIRSWGRHEREAQKQSKLQEKAKKGANEVG